MYKAEPKVKKMDLETGSRQKRISDYYNRKSPKAQEVRRNLPESKKTDHQVAKSPLSGDPSHPVPQTTISKGTGHESEE